ncbi:MAG: hypothetical protein IJE93_08495, partial [Clostridia bacterium]|nr:hypothetical protein [Clostridia bacterium]
MKDFLFQQRSFFFSFAYNIHFTELYSSDVFELFEKCLSFVKVEDFLSFFSQYTPPLVLGISSPIAIQWEFPITFEMAQTYQKARGKWIQKRNWHDIT